MKNLRPQIAIAALALGASLFSVQAFAQQRNVNDGGPVIVPPGAKLDATPTASLPVAAYGRNVNDGGLVAEPKVAQAKPGKTKKTATQAPAPQHFGRNVDDGGPIQ